VSSSEIFALRKQGRSTEALEMARAEHPNNADDIWFLRAYAWALYDHAKKLVDAYEAKQLSPTVLTGQLTPYMRELAKIASSLRGDSAFSQMLRLAGKASKDWQGFLGFARWAGVNDFSEEDKASFVNDQGKTIDSLQKRFTRAICRETVNKASDPQSDKELIEWGLSILEQALREEPNDQWLNYYQSKLHLAHGEADLAIKRLVPVLCASRERPGPGPCSVKSSKLLGQRMRSVAMPMPRNWPGKSRRSQRFVSIWRSDCPSRAVSMRPHNKRVWH